jgi:hypothetical protein
VLQKGHPSHADAARPSGVAAVAAGTEYAQHRADCNASKQPPEATWTHRARKLEFKFNREWRFGATGMSESAAGPTWDHDGIISFVTGEACLPRRRRRVSAVVHRGRFFQSGHQHASSLHVRCRIAGRALGFVSLLLLPFDMMSCRTFGMMLFCPFIVANSRI